MSSKRTCRPDALSPISFDVNVIENSLIPKSVVAEGATTPCSGGRMTSIRSSTAVPIRNRKVPPPSSHPGLPLASGPRSLMSLIGEPSALKLKNNRAVCEIRVVDDFVGVIQRVVGRANGVLRQQQLIEPRILCRPLGGVACHFEQGRWIYRKDACRVARNDRRHCSGASC